MDGQTTHFLSFSVICWDVFQVMVNIFIKGSQYYSFYNVQHQ